MNPTRYSTIHTVPRAPRSTETQFSIAEKEEIVAELRLKWAQARHAANLAAIEADEAKQREDAAWAACGAAQSAYALCEKALLDQIEATL
jgi:hypothetical protein